MATTPATSLELICATCSKPVEPGDRFCPSCGSATVEPTAQSGSARTAAGSPDELDALLATIETRIDWHQLLAVHRPFCRSCGIDHDTSETDCPACGVAIAPLPGHVTGTLGLVYPLRRTIRKRPAVRVGDDGDAARLLLESGEIESVEISKLPEPLPPPTANGLPSTMRTPHGSLLRLVAAGQAGALKSKWDADALTTAALAAVGDITTARLVALDALALGQIELLRRLPLTEPECLWLRACHAAAAADHVEAIAAIAELPPAGYREKLAILAAAVPPARADGLDLASLEPQLAAFTEAEPLARLLSGALGFAPAQAAATEDSLLNVEGIPDSLAAELSAVRTALAGRSAERSALAYLPTNSRVVLALSEHRQGLVRPADIDHIALSLLDDLIDDGAIDRDGALAGSTDAERTRYLLARLAPERLTDDDIEHLGHAGERVRRAFRHADLEALDQAADSPAVLHYRALLTLRGRRPTTAIVDHVLPDARPVVDGLLRLAAAKGEGGPLSDLLTDTLVGDPTVWPALVDIAGPTGLEPTAELRERFPEFAEWLSLVQAREHLFLGEWSEAVAAADRCLALAKDEAVRDEAQNLKACGLHYLGNDKAAIATLEDAIEGAYSESLLANIGIVAAGLEPETAAQYLGLLMVEAPTLPMRVAAARRALSIWQTSDTESWRNSDSSPLPDAFQDAFRKLVVGPLELDDFRDFVGLLSIYDSEWLRDERSLASSPHRDTLEARFYRARAIDLLQMIDVMGAAMANGSAPQWVVHERDSLRSAALEILFENLDKPDSTFGSVALKMADEHVLATAEDQVLFSFLGIASVTYHLSSREQEVADQLVARLHEQRRDWQQQLDAEQQARVEPIAELATRRVALNRMGARDRELSEAIDVFNGALDLGRNAMPGSPAYLEAMRRIRGVTQVAVAARDDVRPFLPLIDHAGARDDINQTVETTRELERRCLEILG